MATSLADYLRPIDPNRPEQVDATYVRMPEQAPEPPKRNWLAAGASAGIDELQGIGGALASQVGKLTGISPLEQWGREVSERNQQEAAQNGRPDLEVHPWREGGAPILPWAGYQVAKQLPLLAGYFLAPEVAVPSTLAKFGAQVVPRVMGGGRGLAVEAAEQAGRNWAQGAVKSTAMGSAIGSGSMYQQAIERGDPTVGDAVKALAMAPIYGAADAFGLEGLVARGLRSGTAASKARNIVQSAAVSAASEGPTEAFQTAMELSFRPDIPVHQKMDQIVDAGITGFAVGGLFGGAAGLRRTPKLDPNASTDDIGAMVNDALAGPQPLGLPAPTVFVNPAGRASPSMEDVVNDPAGQRYAAQMDAEARANPITTRPGRPYEGLNDLALQNSLAIAERNNRTDIAEALRSEIDSRNTAFVEDLFARTKAPKSLQGTITDRNSAELWVTDNLKKIASGKAPVYTRNLARALDFIDDSNVLTPKGEAAAAQRLAPETAPSAVGPFNTPALESLREKVTSGTATPPEMDRFARQVQQMRALGQEFPDVANQSAAVTQAPEPAPAMVEPILAPAPARPAAVAPEFPAVAAPTLQDLEFLRSRGQATPSQLEQLAQVERLATPRAPETVLDARQIVPLLEAVRSGQATPEQNNQVARLVAQFRAQNQEIPETAGPARPAPYIQNISEDATGQIVQNDLAGRVQQAPVAPALDTTAQQRMEGLLQRVEAGGRLSQLEQNEVNRELARRSAQPQAPVETQLDLGIPLPPKEYRAELRRQLAELGKGPSRAKIPDTVVDDASRNEWILGRFNENKGPGVRWPEVAAQRFGLIDANGQPTAAQTQGATNAVQEQGPAGNDVRQAAPAGGEVPSGNAQGNAAPGPSVVKGAAQGQQGTAEGQQAAAEGRQESTASGWTGEKPVTARGWFSRIAEQVAASGGLTKQQATNALGSLLKRAKNAPDVVLYDTREAPQTDVEREAASNVGRLGAYIERPGQKPTIVVLTDRHATVAQLKATLFHELLGHYGLRSAFGQAYNKLLQDIYQTSPWLRTEIEKLGGYQNLSEAARVEEWLSRQQENGPMRASLMDKFTNFLKSFARRWGYTGSYSAAEVRAILARASDAVMEGGQQVVGTDNIIANRTIGDVNRDVAKVYATVTNQLRQGSALRELIDRGELAVGTRNHIVARFGRLFKSGGLNQSKTIDDNASAMRDTLMRVTQKINDQYLAADKKTQTIIAEKLEPAAAQRIDPTKKWKDNEHVLTDDAAYNARLKEIHKEAYDGYNALRRVNMHHVWDDMVANNQTLLYLPQSTSLYQMMVTSTETTEAFKSTLKHPLEVYAVQRGLDDDAQKTRDFWKAQTDKLMAQGTEFVQAKGVQVSKERDPAAAARAKELNDLAKQLTKVIRTPGTAIDDAARQSIANEVARLVRVSDQPVNRVSMIAARILEMKLSMAAMEQAPYIHAARFGDKVVSFSIRTKDDGKVDVEALDAIAEHFEEQGITDVRISSDLTNPSVFIRSETGAEQDHIYKAAKAMEAKGFAAEVRARDRAVDEVNYNAPREWFDRLLVNTQASFATEAELATMDPAERQATETAQKAVIDAFRRNYIDMMPDTAYAKVMVQRKNVQGRSRDFVRAYSTRAEMGIHAATNLYRAQGMHDAMKSMRQDLQKAAAESPPNVVRQMSQVLREVTKREEIRPQIETNTWTDLARAINHNYFLSLSPAYVMLQLTQLPVMLLPELAKHHNIGFKKATQAIWESRALAWNITQTAIREGWSVSASRAADGIVTETVLKNAKVSEADRDYLMSLMHKISSGSAARNLSRVAEGRTDSRLDTALRWSASFGHYAELFTRLNAALAIRQLGLQKDAARIIDDTMLEYSSGNTGRAFGKAGIAGQYTPLAMAFYQYPIQVMEKLAREAFTAMSKEAGAAEARRFIGYHLGAVTVLAGTLGLPFAGAAAAVIDRLKDLLDGDDEPYDVKAAWRNFLSDVLGKDVGEIVARGVPRALGIEVSARLGEQGLLPFTKLLSDRRTIDDASRDWARDLLGSPFGMGLNIWKGLEKLGQGKILEGMQEALPVALKNPIKAYRMTEEGYVDNRGNKLPIQPGGLDVLKQALGLTPAEKAEYQEQKQTLEIRRGILTREASNIRKELATAIERKDRDAAKEWMAEAKRFDKANPDFAVLPGLGSTLQRRARERKIAESTGTPLGARPKELGRVGDLTRFANYDRML